MFKSFTDAKDSNKAITAGIKAAGTSLATARDKIQYAAVLIVNHALLFDDVSAGTRLLDAVKGADRQALVTWFETHGPFRLKDGAFKLNKAGQRTMAPLSEDEMAALPAWYELVPGVKTLRSKWGDVDKRIASLIASALEGIAKGQEVEAREVDGVDTLAALRAFALQRGIKVEAPIVPTVERTETQVSLH